jgi:hypothetical protein
VTVRPIDVHALPAMLTALRLPSFHRHWPSLAERADKEGWPAARFLAALAEIELAERETRRIRRHLLEARLPGGKTLATFDFKALPSIPRARIEALAAGDWLAPISSPSATQAPARPISSAPSPTPSSRPDDASSTPAPLTSCKNSKPPGAISPSSKPSSS